MVETVAATSVTTEICGRGGVGAERAAKEAAEAEAAEVAGAEEEAAECASTGSYRSFCVNMRRS